MAQHNAARQIWPNLPQGTPDEVEQRRTPKIGDALWPSLTPQPKPAPNPYRESLLRIANSMHE